MAASYSERLVRWFLGLGYDDLPADVVENTRLHVLDIIGLALLVGTQPFAGVVRRAVGAMGSGEECRILGSGGRTSGALAALANGAMAGRLDYDDTHNETHLHHGPVIVSAALAAGEMAGVDGRGFLAAVAGGNEIGCRLAVVAPGQFVRSGFHTTALVGTLSSAVTAARLFGLTPEQATNAVGIAGSQASGILQCFSDGTWTKALHFGWAPHGGLTAALLAREGFLAPAEILEGRWGLFRSHVPYDDAVLDFDRMLHGLGEHWESRAISIKLYPAGCVIHPYLDAVLHLHRHEGLRAEQVETITLPVSPHWVPLICEPVAEKLRPATEMAARVSLNYSVAEALYRGGLGVDGYAEENIANPDILALAARTRYVVDENPPPRRDFQGRVVVETTDGRTLERTEDPWNKGYLDNPETSAQVRAKFRENASRALPEERVEAIIHAVAGLEDLTDIRRLVDLCVTEESP